MPIYDKQLFLDQSTSGLPEAPQPTPEKESPGFLETLGASFGQGNTVVALNRKREDLFTDFGAPDPSYDPLSDDNLAGYERDAHAFIGVTNKEHSAYVKSKLDEEYKRRDIIASSPTWAQISGAVVAEGLLDPLSLIPVASIAKKAGRAKSIAQGVATGLGYGAAAGATRESILQSTQLTRTAQESVNNVLLEATIGSVLGGSFGYLSKANFFTAKNGLNDAVAGKDGYTVQLDPDTNKFSVSRDDSVGASRTSFDYEQESLANISKGVVGAVSGLGIDALKPITVRGLTANSGVIRRFTNAIFDHGFVLKGEIPDAAGDTIGRAQSAQLLVQRDRARMIQNNTKVSDLYLKHTGVGKIRSAIARPEGKVSYEEFQSRVSRALNDPEYVDSIPEVMEARAVYRKELDYWADELKAAGLLDDGIDLKADNYLTRVYDVDGMQAPGMREKFIRDVAQEFMKFNKDGTRRVFDDVGDREEAWLMAQDAAQQTYNKIVRQGDDAATIDELVLKASSGGKFGKERELNLPYNVLEPFLVKDASQLVNSYATRASNIVRTLEKLRALPEGVDSINELKIKVNDDYNSKINNTTDEKTARKLIKEQAEALNLVDDIWKASTGTLLKSQKGGRWFERLRNYQYVRLLGGVLLSSISELAMPVLRHGLFNVLRDGYLPMIRSVKTARLARDQFRDLNVGLELEMNNILEAIADTGVSLGAKRTPYDRAMSIVSDAFGKATGLSHFTAFGRRLAAHVASSDLIRTLNKKGPLTKTEKRRMASAGIGTDDYDIIRDQIKKHSEKVDGSWVSNHDLWDNQRAATLFKDYIQRQTNNTVLYPGAGDIPAIFQSTELGKLLFQFKSFGSAATGRIAISSIQNIKEQRTITGLLFLTALGTLSGLLKDKIAGRESSDNPAELVLDGMARSGVPGLIGTTLLDAGLVAANGDTRRFGGKNMAGQILGPSVGQIQDVSDLLLNRLADGEITEGDIQAGLRTLPFNNIPYIKKLTDAALAPLKGGDE